MTIVAYDILWTLARWPRQKRDLCDDYIKFVICCLIRKYICGALRHESKNVLFCPHYIINWFLIDMMNGGKTRKKQGINWKERKWNLPINVEKSKMVYLHLTICCCRHHHRTFLTSCIFKNFNISHMSIFWKKDGEIIIMFRSKKVCSTFRFIWSLGLTNYSYTYKLNLEPKACPSKENINTFARINWFSKINR